MASVGLNSAMFLTGLRALNRSQAAIAGSLERLATGKKINRASDDVGGFRAAEKLHQRRVQLAETIEMAQRANAVIDIAEGAMAEMETLVVQLQGLVAQSANRDGLSEDELDGMQVEANSILDAMDLLAASTTFDGEKLFSGKVMINVAGSAIAIPRILPEGLGGVVIEPEEEGEERTTYSLGDLRGALGFREGNMEIAQQVADSAVEALSVMRSRLGMYRKDTLGHQADANQVELENTIAAESLITDADFAEEVGTLARAQIMEGAAIMVLRMTQQNAGSVLDLMKPMGAF